MDIDYGARDDIRNSKIINNISNLLDDGILCDVIIVIGDGEEIRAHKTILAAGSKYFRTMFTTPMIRESETRVNLQMFDKDTVENIINILYNRTISCMNVIDMIKCADYLLIDDLVAECEYYIKKYTCHDNCIYLYHRLYEMSHIPITNYIKRMVIHNMPTLITTNDFKQIIFEILFDLLSTTDADDYVYREGYKVTILLTWLENNSITEEQMLCILTCIDVYNIDIKSRLLLFSNKTINSYPSCIRFLLDNRQRDIET
ncbi:kelch-like protein [Skunkpox virus]|uniref:Kelch-like protein n=1 Tax=Skunkpox virus TaxID=160796 RepID=A0A1C9KC30_9POXV|nr:kelch-like protein [Skunkpox virus]AOP31676.1 kelch-like protein [Skunkpox virus]